MGVLHRDISDGNVLMLRKGQGYNKRDWKVPCVPTNELDPELVESERLLGEVLDGLGRDPTGMVNDFDLFTTYGEADAPFFDASPKDNVCEVKEPELKRRKLNPETVAPPIPSSSSTEDEDAPEEPHSGPPFDFPVGTPAFMCARVLKVKPGCRFEHHFMDDLESFFWVILVCVLEHVDTPGGRLTQDALDLLRTFNQHDRSHIADSKLDLLGACAGKGKLMLRALASCENSWASDPAIISVVLQLGRYFYDNYDGPYFLCPPTMGFPSIVKPIMDALDL
ncbi:hypothetical protein FRC10_005255 [Ceratobasidium sp. 414]|nr:hypothetical protein FRC10_005255 [Ceratobasidium sp. 414]